MPEENRIDMLEDRQGRLESSVTRSDVQANERKVEILTHAQAKLKDLEDELRVLYAEKASIDALVVRGNESIRKLQEIVAKDEASSHDLGRTIRANLSAIDSLRKDGIEPVKD